MSRHRHCDYSLFGRLWPVARTLLPFPDQEMVDVCATSKRRLIGYFPGNSYMKPEKKPVGRKHRNLAIKIILNKTKRPSMGKFSNKCNKH